MTTAMITGATAGIGAAFTRALAAQGSDLVLVARDAKRLTEHASVLTDTYAINVEVLPADLADPNARARVEARLASPQLPVDCLVNNAGFGLRRPFGRTSVEDEQQLLDVLVTATMRLTHAALPGMLARQHGTILNVSSVAGWITSGSYSAAKAWVTVFSESLATQSASRGVHVTAVCPGYVRTEFHDRAGMDVSSVPRWMWLDADRVAAKALKDAAAGRALSVTGLPYRLMGTLLRQSPRWLVRRATGSPERIERIRSGQVDGQRHGRADDLRQ